MSGQVVMLFSTLSIEQRGHSNQMDALLQAHKLDVMKIDGSDASQKDLRDRLFGISGMRGKYPQCFVKRLDHYEFVGLWDKVEALGECESLGKGKLLVYQIDDDIRYIRMRCD